MVNGEGNESNSVGLAGSTLVAELDRAGCGRSHGSPQKPRYPEYPENFGTLETIEA